MFFRHIMYFASAHTIYSLIQTKEDINQKYATLLLPIYIIFISSLVNYLPYCNNCVHLLYCHFVIDVWNVKESLYSTPHYLTTFYCYYYYYYLTFSVLIISGYQFDRLPKYTFLTCISFPVLIGVKEWKWALYIYYQKKIKSIVSYIWQNVDCRPCLFFWIIFYLFKGGEMGIWYIIIHIFPGLRKSQFLCCIPKKKGCCAVIYVAKET